MSRGLIVCAVLLALLGIALWWLVHADAPAPEPTTRSVEPRATPARSAPPSLAGPAQPSPTPAPAPQPSAPAEAKPTEQRSIQRDDGTALTGKPTFARESIAAIKTVATPAVARCIEQGLARAGDAGVEAQVGVVFTARASAGQITTSEPRVVIPGVTDDELVRCVENVYKQLRVEMPGQSDAVGQVMTGFPMQ